MHSFRTFVQLNELFQSARPWTWVQPHKQARFSIGDKTYSVYIERGELSFELDGTPDEKRHDILNTGNQFAVFATVLDVLRAYVSWDKYHDRIHFTAKEPSRRKLYDRMVPMLRKAFPFHVISGGNGDYWMRAPTSASDAHTAWAASFTR